MPDQPKTLTAADATGWTQEPPTEQGLYWHWHGDIDCAPLPLNVFWSGFSGKCFVSRGQYGIAEAIDCDEYGGWWKPLPDPELPTLKARTRDDVQRVLQPARSQSAGAPGTAVLSGVSEDESPVALDDEVGQAAPLVPSQAPVTLESGLASRLQSEIDATHKALNDCGICNVTNDGKFLTLPERIEDVALTIHRLKVQVREAQQENKR